VYAPAPLYDVTISRNAWQGVTAVTDNDSVGLDHTASFGYDGFARLTAATVGRGAGAYTFGYGYDGLQNMVSRTQTSGPRVADLLLGTYQYGPDAAGPRQLKSVVEPGGRTHAFTYDGAGRQITQSGMRLVYSDLDELVRVEGLPGGGVLQHAYGYDGIRVKTVAPSGDVSYWFSEGVSVRGGVREYTVKVGDRVVARVKMPSAAARAAAAGVDARELAGKGLALLVMLLSLGGIVWVLRTPTRAPRGRRVIAVCVTGAMFAAGCGGATSSWDEARSALATRQVTYLHQGVSAGPTIFTGPAGELVEERRYEPFGEDLDAYRRVSGRYVVANADFASIDANVLNKRTDATTGWSYHGARWMGPQTARWLTPDPPTKAPDPKYMAEPWSLHPYQYVDQNPVTFWDPDGCDKKSSAPTTQINVVISARSGGHTYTRTFSNIKQGDAIPTPQGDLAADVTMSVQVRTTYKTEIHWVIVKGEVTQISLLNGAVDDVAETQKSASVSRQVWQGDSWTTIFRPLKYTSRELAQEYDGIVKMRTKDNNVRVETAIKLGEGNVDVSFSFGFLGGQVGMSIAPKSRDPGIIDHDVQGFRLAPQSMDEWKKDKDTKVD
jgi:RHS repeat-associated protein